MNDHPDDDYDFSKPAMPFPTEQSTAPVWIGAAAVLLLLAGWWTVWSKLWP